MKLSFYDANDSALVIFGVAFSYTVCAGDMAFSPDLGKSWYPVTYRIKKYQKPATDNKKKSL